MIISNSRKFIFVHVHKCAGSTIANALAPYTQWDDIELGVTEYGEAIQQPYRSRFGLWKHARARDARDVLGSERFAAYFKFAFVRSPLHRVISFYTFIRQLEATCPAALRPAVAQWPISKAMRETSCFSEFIRHPEFREPPMFRLLTEAPDKPRRIIVDFVGKVESIATDMPKVFERIGIPLPEHIENKNVSKAEVQRLKDYYANEDDLRFIHEKFTLDFELFGYSIDDAISSFRLDL